MNWLLVVLLAVLIFFVFKASRKRIAAQREMERRNAQRAAQNTSNLNGRAGSNGHAVKGNQANGGNPAPAPHDAPSLLYADRGENDRRSSSNENTKHEKQTDPSNNPIPAIDKDSETYLTDAGQSDSSASESYNPSSQDQSTSTSASDTSTSSSTLGKVAGVAGVAGAVSAATAFAANTAKHSGENTEEHSEAKQSEQQSEQSAQQESPQNETQTYAHTHNHLSDPQNESSRNNGIDLEISSAPDYELDSDDDDDYDEVQDFGDLTADISEMLKELNLRETDSPRLDIDTEEFAQLKTGQPGEVKPEKIENVAGKLRNMLD